jgi:uncharacterized Fe-S cluster-containing radical SAM superfamily protein
MTSPLFNIKNFKSLFNGRLPGQLVIQYSNYCNADCPQCGMRRSATLKRHTLDRDVVKKLIDDAAVRGIQSLSFTGGEPLLFLNELTDLIHHAGAAGIPFIRTGTNGFLFRNSDQAGYLDSIKSLAEKLAATSLYTFWISLDSAEPADHEAMRGLTNVVKGIELALPVFHDHGIYPAVNLGINRATGGSSSQVFLDTVGPEEFYRSYCTAFIRFYTLAENLGFTMVNSCYPMSGGSNGNSDNQDSIATALYGAASSDAIITFSAPEKAIIFQALFDTIPQYRDKLRIFSPRCSLHSLHKKFSSGQPAHFPCRGGYDFFFVDCAHGMIHPCGYRDEPQEELPDFHQRVNDIKNCDLCEWECFRDPSDLLGPFAELFVHPLTLARRIGSDRQFFKILQEDIGYYRACGFFNGREAPDYRKMARYEVRR